MLLELQQDFRRHLLREQAVSLSNAVLADGLSAQARLQVYRNHVTLSLREALRTTFPVTQRLVGEEFFAGMARQFIAAHPPLSPCLSEFGGAFPDFIAAFPPAAMLPYLPDVARLEWALNEAWHSGIEPALEAASLAVTDPEAAAASTLELQPSLRLLTSAWPVEMIWRANQSGQDGSGIDLAAGGCDLLIWREGDDAVFRSVAPEAAAMVRGLQADGVLHSAFALAGAAEALGLLLANGLIVGRRAVAPA
ncbi:MAG: hypothetical protein K0S54_2927 [Alphaproteobacteria bacterium]|nr:hypothetical protein [Alphaproteobacteria bacterium]